MPPPRRRVVPRRLPAPSTPTAGSSALQTRVQLFTYAFSRLPPRQLPLLGIYAYLIVYAAGRGWIDRKIAGKAGTTIVNVLSMVTGLLLSYRFSSAISKWDEGKKVWVDVRVAIRDGVRTLSVPPSIVNEASPAVTSSSAVDIGEMSPTEAQPPASDTAPTNSDPDGDVRPITGENVATSSPASQPSPPSLSPATSRKSTKGKEKATIVQERTDELSSLLVGFAFALQHHLHSTRPLPQPPLCDLLPPGYLSSLKRTEARVRFAESHAGPYSPPLEKTSPPTFSSPLPGTSSASSSTIQHRPGLRRRSTGPPTESEKTAAASAEEWELSVLRIRAEEAVHRLSEAVRLSGGGAGEDLELKQQLSQLNVPPNGVDVAGTGPISMQSIGLGVGAGATKPKSSLYSPHPGNLPLALLRLMEVYAEGLADVPPEQGGWGEAKRERMLGVIKTLSASLGESERLVANPPPLPLTLHLSHLLLIYLASLPPSLLCIVPGPLVILITLIAGWCFLGLEALVGEVGGVFGGSENHQPLPLLTRQILSESIEGNPRWGMGWYARRVAGRCGEESEEVKDIERRCRRINGGGTGGAISGGSEGEWLPTFV